MKKYRCSRDVVTATGSQEFEIAADSPEEAKKKFIAGEADIVQSDVEVEALEDFDFDEMWIENEHKTNEQLKRARDDAIRDAEKSAHAYFAACDIGHERIKAGEIYENIRTSVRVY